MPPQQSRLASATTHPRMPVALAIVALLVFAAGCTILGFGVAKTVQPCPQPWASILKLGPGGVSLLAILGTVDAARRGRANAWLPALLGVIGAIAALLFASAVIHAF